MPNKQIKKIKLGEETYSIAVENILQKVDTIDDVPTSELNLYRYDKEGISSPVVEVVSEYHEGGDSNVFAKTSTANNNSLTSTSAFAGHFDATLSNFVTIDSISGSVYTYNNNYPMNGIRLGTKTAIGYINVTFLQDGSLTFHRYFGFNGSTGEITSYDADASVVVDGVTYNFSSNEEDLFIPVRAGTHTIENVNGRILFLSFIFGGEAYYTYEKKHLARQEDIESIVQDFEASIDTLETKILTNEKAIQKNAQDISTVDSKIGSVQIYDVLKSLPKASMNHLDEIYRLDKKLYQCVQKGDGVHKDFAFNLSGDSEILSSHLESLYPTIAKDFTEYLEFDLESSSKVFRNNGSIKLGSSKAAGELRLVIADDFILNKPLRALKVGVKAYNKDKSTITVRLNSSSSEGEASYLIEDFTNETLLDLSHLNILKSAIELDYVDNSDEIESIVITTSDRYVKYTEEESEVIYTDNRGCITRIIADFGDIIYEWEGVGGSDPLIKITYNELKDLRDNSQLIPGQQYRITDYETTTSQIDTIAAGHQFDIIVTADSENALNENARAIRSETEVDTWMPDITASDIQLLFKITNTDYYDDDSLIELNSVVAWDLTYVNGVPAFYDMDPETEDIGTMYVYGGTKVLDGEIYDLWWETFADNTGEVFGRLTNKVVSNGYFYNSKVESWELKYCLDNDTNRFKWAQIAEATSITVAQGDTAWTYVRKPELETKLSSEVRANNKYIWWDNDTDDTIMVTNTANPDLLPATSFVRHGHVEGATTDGGLDVDFWSDAAGEIIDVTTRDLGYGEFGLGKGVIYYMKDEWNNEAPYDFKNILFPRKFLADGSIDVDQNDDSNTIWVYTFSIVDKLSVDTVLDWTANQLKLRTMAGEFSICCNNKILANSFELSSILSNNVFICNSSDYSTWYTTADCKNNQIEQNCNANTLWSVDESLENNIIKVWSSYNTIGPGWNGTCNNIIGAVSQANKILGSYNKIGDDCIDNIICGIYNTIGDACDNNVLGDDCNYNTFKCECRNNTLGEGCDYNNFEQTCWNHTLEDYCINNSFGKLCEDNTLGYGSSSNSFGQLCSLNQIGAYSGNNYFGNNCAQNIIGEECSHNAFENNCTYNTINSNSGWNVIRHHSSHIDIAQFCEQNIFGSCNMHNSISGSSYKNIFGDNCIGNTLGNCCWSNITFESNVNYTKLQKPTDAPAEPVYNITVANGVSGKSTSNQKIITVTKEPEDKTPIIYKAANTTEIILD